MKSAQFHVSIPTVTVNETTFVLTSDEEMENLRSGIVSLKAQIAETDAKLAEWDAIRKTLKKGESHPVDIDEIETAQIKVMSLKGQLSGLQQGLETAERIRAKYAEKIVTLEFDLHTYSFNEKKSAQDDATVFDGLGKMMVREGDFVLNILFASMDRWNLEDDITRENIGALPPSVVTTLHNKLAMHSEPNEARLDFLP